MPKASQNGSELTAAAEALESGLRSFEEFAEGLTSAPLNSQKAIERVAKLLNAVADMDERLSSQVKRLVSAVGKARERQEKQAEAIQKRAKEIQTRVAMLQDLMEEYGRLGRSAAELNGQMQEVASARAADAADANDKLGQALERMGAWAEQARELVERSEREEFPDIGRLADSLRQQLLAARNKAQLLLQKN